MELTRILRLLWDRRGVMVLGLVFALIVSVSLSYRLNTSPLKLEPKTSTYGSASTQVFIDSKRSSIATLAGNTSLLSSRSNLFAQFLTSQEVRDDINQRMGLPRNSIPVISSPNTVQRVQTQALSESNQIAGDGSQSSFSISFQPQLELPIIDIYTRGPTAQDAIKLADVAAESLSRQVGRLSDASGVPENSPSRIVMREIGPATGGQVSTSISVVRLVVTFGGFMLFWCLAIVGLTWLRADWSRVSAERASADTADTAA